MPVQRCVSPPTRHAADTSVYVCINSHLSPDNKVSTRGGRTHVARFGEHRLIHRSPLNAGQEKGREESARVVRDGETESEREKECVRVFMWRGGGEKEGDRDGDRRDEELAGVEGATMARHIFMRIYIRHTRTNVRLSNESSSYTKLDALTYTQDSRRDATCLIICILRIRAALHRLMPVYSAMLRVYAAKGRIVTVPHLPFHLLNRAEGGEAELIRVRL